MENPPIAKEIVPNEEICREAVVVTSQEVMYLGNENNAQSRVRFYNDDYEEVKVEEKYCGPITCIIGTLLFIVFWPATAFMGCCLCDKRKVKKRRVD